jgi:hypothetical protein
MTERQNDRTTERLKDRRTERQAGREEGRLMDRLCTDRHPFMHVCKQADRHTEERWADVQTEGWTDVQTEKWIVE